MDQRTRVLAFLIASLAPVIGAAVALIPSGEPLPAEQSGSSRRPNPVQSAFPAVTRPPGGGTADAGGLVHEFDLMPTGQRVTGWHIRGEGSLDVAAVPTAVDRSARFAPSGEATACHPAADAVSSLTIEFMIDPLPAGTGVVLLLGAPESALVTLTISDNVAVLSNSKTVAPFAPGDWYRWTVRRRADSVEASLTDAEGQVLVHAESGRAGAQARSICVSAREPARVYLDALRLEGG